MAVHTILLLSPCTLDVCLKQEKNGKYVNLFELHNFLNAS